jgi:hypothetical protein
MTTAGKFPTAHGTSHVVLLSAQHRAEIAEYVRTVEPRLRKGATIELDGRRPVAELADAIEKLLGPAH